MTDDSRAMDSVSALLLGDTDPHNKTNGFSVGSTVSSHNFDEKDTVQGRRPTGVHALSLIIPPYLAPQPFGEEQISLKRPHWAPAVKREKYGDEIEHPWTLSKKEMLEEIKWSLTADMSKSLFSQSPDGTIRFNELCHIRGLSQGCVVSLLRPITEAVLVRMRLEHFVVEGDQLLATLKSLRAWLAEYLKEWKGRILDLPSDSLLQCSFSLRPLMDELFAVYSIVESAILPCIPQDFELVNLLVKKCFYVAEQAAILEKSSGADGSKNSRLTVDLLLISIKATISQMNNWISGKDLRYTESVSLPFCNRQPPVAPEFFIEVQDESQSRYNIRGNLNPVVRDIASDLVSARMSIVVFHRLIEGHSNSVLRAHLNNAKNILQTGFSMISYINSNDSVLPSALKLRHCLHFDVKSQCLKISKLLVDTVCDRLHLGKLLEEIRDIVTSRCFNDVPYEREADKRADDVYLRRYTECMNEISLYNRTNGFMQFPWRFDVKTHKLSDSETPVQVIDFSCQLSWPLNVIVTAQHMRSYCKIFHFFLDLECARARLARLRIFDLVPMGSVGRRLSLQRFELFVFLTKIVAAVSYEFHSCFSLDKVLDALSIDELCKNHDRMVHILSSVTLSDDRSAAWNRLMLRLTDLSCEVEASWRNAHITEIDMIKSRLTFDSCKRLFSRLLEKKYASYGM